MVTEAEKNIGDVLSDLDLGTICTTEKLEKIRGLRLLDDSLMAIALGGCKEAVELVLRIVMGNGETIRDDINVVKCSGQFEVKNPAGHEVRFDVYAEDDCGRHYDLEIQRSDHGAVAKRLRYHSGQLDSTLLPPKTDYSLLPETYIIFVTENDVRKGGRPKYIYGMTDEETNEPLDDKQHLIFVNNEYEGDDPLGRLMQDFRQTDPDKIYYPILAERVRYIKNTKKGVVSMCRLMEAERKEGIMEEKKATILRLWRKGHHDICEIADIADCSNDMVVDVLRDAGLL